MGPVKVKPIAVPVFLKRKKQCLVPKGYVHARK